MRARRGWRGGLLLAGWVLDQQPDGLGHRLGSPRCSGMVAAGEAGSLQDSRRAVVLPTKVMVAPAFVVCKQRAVECGVHFSPRCLLVFQVFRLRPGAELSGQRALVMPVRVWRWV